MASKARTLTGIRLLLVAVKFNVPMLKANIDDYVNSYLSYVLKMARINLFVPFSPFLAGDNLILQWHR